MMISSQNIAFTPISLSRLPSHRLIPSKPPSLPFHPISAVHSPKSAMRIGSPLTARAAASTAGLSDNISDALGEVNIFSAAGAPVMFKDLWELASALKESKPKFDAAGVKLIAVGVGTPDKARILAERLPFPLDCLYADPDRKAYDVLGLYYGIGRTFFNPASAKVFSRFGDLQKSLKNYTLKATPADKSSVLQQGGMFVFKGKQLLYARKDEGTGDHAPLDDIFNICCKVPVA
ncbi:hypothetical protein C3L33_01329, partial [Rhododendron williamsianum]